MRDSEYGMATVGIADASSIVHRPILILPFSRGGRRIVCHDDRYILKTAAEKQAVIVSNDEYRDLVRECPRWRVVVESLLLMYSFVDGQ